MHKINHLPLAILAASVPLASASAQCPPGYTVRSHQVLKEGDAEFDQWTCAWVGGPAAKTALQQLQNMGKGYVDTTTGFDGGQGPSAAVATAPRPAQLPNLSAITINDLQKFGNDPAYSQAVTELHLAKEERKQIEQQIADLHRQQDQAKDSLAKQKIQIAIAKMSPELTRAKGAERIASNAVVKEVIRLKPEVVAAKPGAKQKAKK